METTVERITPSMATKYLEMNTNNRTIRQSHVDFLAKEIKDDRWVLNGASIVFDGPTLVDGQHRLWAVVTAGKPISTLVARGVDKDCFPTIDTGIGRTAGDSLHITGMKNASHLASAARFIMEYHSGKLLKKQKISNGSVVDFVSANPGLAESATFILSITGAKIFSRSVATALHYLMAKKDKELADTLFAGIYKGFSGAAGFESFAAMREKLIACATHSTRAHAVRTSMKVLSVYVIKAWNAKRKGLRMRIFKFAPEEEFPKIK
jgi:hypothetical protein